MRLKNTWYERSFFGGDFLHNSKTPRQKNSYPRIKIIVFAFKKRFCVKEVRFENTSEFR